MSCVSAFVDSLNETIQSNDDSHIEHTPSNSYVLIDYITYVRALPVCMCACFECMNVLYSNHWLSIFILFMSAHAYTHARCSQNAR